ncbi:beta-lactamase [Pseudonocardia sp. Ae717_Ps2]|uniref:MBL fold metallo-hydrolase n=1 Tax=Pseudonocardia sp. Ae717_Ps2 TaxID=1885573 RepID=UPI00094AE152|nr:MBL fold metallo-hydrolase [Pseudonocardia sp. Ae717_Ps2]OLM34285.1 beta-lactamase [Pseudonocardia sp. Ae717_Ps2]
MTIQLRGPVTVERITELDDWPFGVREMFPAHPSDGPISLVIATHLVRTPDLTVLVDAGNGDGRHRPGLPAHHLLDAGYAARLAARVAPEEIDVVVCSHLHPDHCGGLTTADARPAFPGARHLVSRAELAWLGAVHRSAPGSGVAEGLARTWEDSVAPVLDAGLVDPVGDGDGDGVNVDVDLGHGVRLRAAPGHTPGHLVVEIGPPDGPEVVIGGDVLHHPLQFDDLDLAQAGDADPARAARTRRDLCERLARSGGLLLPSHFTPGRVRRAGDGFAYTPSP